MPARPLTQERFQLESKTKHKILLPIVNHNVQEDRVMEELLSSNPMKVTNVDRIARMVAGNI